MMLHLVHGCQGAASDGCADSLVRGREPHGYFATQRESATAYSLLVHLWQRFQVIDAPPHVPQPLADQDAALLVDRVLTHVGRDRDEALGRQYGGETLVVGLCVVD